MDNFQDTRYSMHACTQTQTQGEGKQAAVIFQNQNRTINHLGQLACQYVFFFFLFGDGLTGVCDLGRGMEPSASVKG